MSESLKDILNDMTFAMIFPVKVYKVVQLDATTLRFYVDNAWHAEPKRTFDLQGNTYTIKAVDNFGVSIDTDTNILPSFPDTFNLYGPYFFHGTPIETNTDLQDITDANDKTPMVWLMENFSEDFHLDPEDPHERTSTVRLFFLTQSDFSLTTEAIHERYIKPMRRLMENWLANMKRNFTFEIWDKDYTVTDYTKFGVFIQNKGVPTQLMADKLTGCELSITFNILKRGSCCVPQSEEQYLATEAGIILANEQGVPITL